jgi:trans-2,3-dihydro-3-hydroxyanthranilate isomerase
MSEPTHPYEVLDVFTDTPLEGNALAVFTQGELIPSTLFQRIARELNLSETVFITPGDPSAGFDAEIRIFTPGAELPFAGHPTLGSAFVVAAILDLAVVRLKTQAGVVPVRMTREHGELTFGEMDQPIPRIEPHPDPQAVLEALGVSETLTPIVNYTNGPTHTVVVLGSGEAVAALDPDMGLLKASDVQAAVVALTGHGTAKTRNFAPRLGVPEDPATGSAAGPLALHLALHGLIEFGEQIVISQGVEIGRPSTLHARVEGNASEPAPIVVGGSAVVVARGNFRFR